MSASRVLLSACTVVSKKESERASLVSWKRMKDWCAFQVKFIHLPAGPLQRLSHSCTLVASGNDSMVDVTNPA
ncbi:hypothetical protein Ciccas_007071 [Cichlidogyrus casuarinus]|uniref:Uncharacterized protein n=1 Tax=Cichlidogyrus casuarinus TaxID=1844966 RepID=A0ABD2Q3X2_9PLAT